MRAQSPRSSAPSCGAIVVQAAAAGLDDGAAGRDLVVVDLLGSDGAGGP
ncbi:hypothetical protein ACPCTO_35780 [Streptomyces olivoreticuli]